MFGIAARGVRTTAPRARWAAARMPVRTAVAFADTEETPFAALIADKALMSRVTDSVRTRWLEEHQRWLEYREKVDAFTEAALGTMGLKESEIEGAGDGFLGALLDEDVDEANTIDMAIDPALLSILDGVPDEALEFFDRQRTRAWNEVFDTLRNAYPSPARYKKIMVTDKRPYHVKNEERRMNHTFDNGLRRRKAAFVKRLVNDTLRSAVYASMKRSIPTPPVRYTPRGSRFPRDYYPNGDVSRDIIVEPFGHMAKRLNRQMVVRGYVRGKSRKAR